MKTLCRLVVYREALYVYQGVKVYEIKPRTKRIICAAPEAAFSGLKPARLNQLNQQGDGISYSMLCSPKHLTRNIGWILRKLKGKIKYIEWRPWDNEHTEYKQRSIDNRKTKKETVVLFQTKPVVKVLVHADGGNCHGTPLVNGVCPKCGIRPDMQSTEMWEIV